MKRFWREVRVAEAGDGHGHGHRVLLDARPVRTPGRRQLSLPSAALARAIAEEWRAQEGEVEPSAMPLTRLASTVIDRLPERRADAIAEVCGYAETDLLCYRADQPVELILRQTQVWQPWLDWAAATYGARLEVTTGLLPASQPAAAHARLRQEVEALDDWQLIGLHAAVTSLGSIVLGLALRARRIDPAGALEAALLDERFQVERWGEEAEQRRRHVRLEADVAAAARFLTALGERPPAGA